MIGVCGSGECRMEGVRSKVKVEEINDLLERIGDEIEVDLEGVVGNEGYYSGELGRG